MTERLCGREANQEMFWPGRPGAPVCDGHAEQAIRMAGAMGFYLSVRALDQPSKCEQIVTAEPRHAD